MLGRPQANPALIGVDGVGHATIPKERPPCDGGIGRNVKSTTNIDNRLGYGVDDGPRVTVEKILRGINLSVEMIVDAF